MVDKTCSESIWYTNSASVGAVVLSTFAKEGREAVPHCWETVILLPKIESPTKDEMTSWHNKHIDELNRIYEEYKEDAFGPEKAKVTKLEVW